MDTKADTIKQAAGALALFASVVAGGAVTLSKLEEKPTSDEVEDAIENKVAPVREQAELVSELREEIEKIQKVQAYQIEKSAWQGDVLDHLAGRHRTPPPPKPATLRAKERELIER